MGTIEERIARFESIKPGSAKKEDIIEGTLLLDLVEFLPFFPEKKVNLLARLGSFYLESHALDPIDSLEGAKICYGEIVNMAHSHDSGKWGSLGWSGVANTLVQQYELSRKREDLDAAENVFRNLIDTCDKLGMIEEASSSRINYSRLLMKATHGDRFSRVGKAIDLLRHARNSSSQQVLGKRFNPGVYSRILHNLGSALIQQEDEAHLKTLYLNEAVDLFQQALLIRSVEEDAAGRARTLRALAMILPEWAGADSLDHARKLADEAIAEALELENSGAIPDMADWKKVRRTSSALHWDMEVVAPSRENIERAIAFHQINIQRIPRDALPYLWAEWVGGYARLTGKMGVEDGNVALLNASHSAFLKALEAVPEDCDTRLCLKLYREFGRISHECANWISSLKANRKAAEIGLSLSDRAYTEVSRKNELENITRAVHFAAFAASQLNLPHEAAELAEIGRARWLDEAIRIAAIRDSSLPIELKATVDKAQAQLLELERLERSLPGKGLGGIARRMENLFGIPFGGALKIRLTADPNETEAKLSNELADVREQLGKAHETLAVLLNSAPCNEVLPRQPTFKQIQAIAQKAGFPLAYLLSSVWGSIAVVVGRDIEIINIPGLKRKQIQDLLYGENGYIQLCAGAIEGDLDASLQAIQMVLDEHLVGPIGRWCSENNTDSIAIVGLGDIGLLPVQVSTIPARLNIRVLPSARALTLSKVIASKPSDTRLMAIGGLASSGLRPLEFSRAESLFFSASYRKAGAVVYDLSDAPSFANIESKLTDATHLLFSCHGNFASFSPLNSSIRLEGDEVLPLESLLRPALKLVGAELVILSACNSASNEFWRTPDETIGFPAAFLAAGARTVVAAQWAVSDAATFLLMQQFCTELLQTNSDVARSLATAQRWLRNATTSQIKGVIDQVYDVLGDEEMRTRRVLKELQGHIDSLEPECPFADIKFWGAFVCVGA